MTAISGWAIDTAYTSVSLTAGDVNSLASGGGALSTTAIANGTNLDQFIDVSFVLTVGGTTTAASCITVYLLPLNQDGSTYGDGYVSSTSSQPAVGYAGLIGQVGVKPGVTSGNTVTGSILFGNLPPGSFKLAIGNNLGVAFGTTAAVTLAYRTYNVNNNAR